MRTRKTNDSDPLLTGIISAAIASGITYFLYGTDKGKETRHKVGEVAIKVKDTALDVKDEAFAHSSMLYNAAKDSYENMTTLLAEHKSTLKNLERDDAVWLAERFKDRMSVVWEETREDIEEVLDDAKV